MWDMTGHSRQLQSIEHKNQHVNKHAGLCWSVFTSEIFNLGTLTPLVWYLTVCHLGQAADVFFGYFVFPSLQRTRRAYWNKSQCFWQRSTSLSPFPSLILNKLAWPADHQHSACLSSPLSKIRNTWANNNGESNCDFRCSNESVGCGQCVLFGFFWKYTVMILAGLHVGLFLTDQWSDHWQTTEHNVLPQGSLCEPWWHLILLRGYWISQIPHEPLFG